MIAKAGIIVATAAASLLAVSPLAFAGDYPGGSDKSHHKSHDGDHKKKDHDKDCKCDGHDKDHGKGHDKDWDGDHGDWGGDHGHQGGHGGHGGWDGHGGNGGGGNAGDKSCKQNNSASSTRGHGGGGLINVSGNTVQVPVQACNNNILNNVVAGILSKGQSATSR